MKDEEFIFRAVPSVNKTDGSATVQTEVQDGTSVWMSSRDKKKTAAGLDLMAEHIHQQLGGNHPELVFHFDCCARGKLMFRDQEKLQLLRRLRRAVGPDVPWMGFYTFGEIGPVGQAQLLPQLHGGRPCVEFISVTARPSVLPASPHAPSPAHELLRRQSPLRSRFYWPL
jgi:small ligand-binding sensory domain FIST